VLPAVFGLPVAARRCQQHALQVSGTQDEVCASVCSTFRHLFVFCRFPCLRMGCSQQLLAKSCGMRSSMTTCRTQRLQVHHPLAEGQGAAGLRRQPRC
jgi:hypothetical protein